MPAKRPECIAGQYYHLYKRGAHKVSIFTPKMDETQ